MEQRSRRITFRWAATIGLIIGTVCVAAFAFLYKLPMIYKYEIESESQNQKKAKFVEAAVINTEASSPYLKTGFDGIFYSVSDSGAVEFLEFSDSNFKKVRASDSFKITLPLGDEKNTVTVKVLEKDGKAEGYGVYSDKNSTTYPYAFLRFAENNITDNSDYIVYVDYSIKDFYSNNKTYETAYAYNSKDNSLEPIFPEDAKEGEYIIPIDFIRTRADGFYYFEEKQDGDKVTYNLYKKNGVGTMESLVCEKLEVPYATVKDGNILILMDAKDQNGADAFNLIKLGKNEDPIHTFSGNANQYIFKDGYVLNPAAKTLYSIKGNTAKTFNTAVTIMNVQDFAVSKDDARLVIMGNFAGNQDKLLAYDFDYEDMKVYDGEGLFLSGNSNPVFVNDYVYFLSPATTASEVINFVVSFENII